MRFQEKPFLYRSAVLPSLYNLKIHNCIEFKAIESFLDILMVFQQNTSMFLERSLERLDKVM